MARAPLLQLSDTSLTFGGNPLFFELSLVVQQGDRVALVGRNGSGKSTLAWIMAGLTVPTSGSCLLDGRPVSDQVGAVALSRRADDEATADSEEVG